MSTATVFLSCRDEDLPLCEPLRRELEARQYTIVRDREAISSAALFVACFSNGGYVVEEVERAIAMVQLGDHPRSWLKFVSLDGSETPAGTGGGLKVENKFGPMHGPRIDFKGVEVLSLLAGQQEIINIVESMTGDREIKITGVVFGPKGNKR